MIRLALPTLAALELLGLLTFAPTSPCQDKNKPDNTLRDFRRFSEEIQDSLIRQLERKVQLDPNDAIQRVVSMQRSHEKLPMANSTPYHKASDWAKGVARKRGLVVRGDERHTTIREKYPARILMPDLHKAVFYDWATGEIVKRGRPLSRRERMENLYHGYPPGADDALARLLKKFDNNKKMRKVGRYLSHLYADLGANVYEGVTLYEAWYSGELIEVPDVDAVPFAYRILRTRAYRSPIPANNRRTSLYKKIRDRAFAYRKYRTLREAAAAAFFRAEPEMDEMYKRLVPRFHYLYAVHRNDTDAIENVLRDADRDTLIKRIDDKIKGAGEEYQKRLGRKKQLEDMYAWLHYWAQLAVYEQNQRGKPDK